MSDNEIEKLAEQARKDGDTPTYIILTQLGHIHSDIRKIQEHYSTNDDYKLLLRRIQLIERIVYGATGLVLLAVFAAMINLVLENGV